MAKKIPPEPNLRVLDILEQTYTQRTGVTLDEKTKQGMAWARAELLAGWEANDIEEVLLWVDNHKKLEFVRDNIHGLIEMGVYEQALLTAYQMHNHNLHCWQPELVAYMFTLADPGKLRAAGDPMPDSDTFTLYRGVAGVGKARRVSGMSWTDSPVVAAWFANRYALADPAVFTVTVNRDQVLAYLTGREESEYLLQLPLPKKPRRAKP